ncbi:OmpA family protein [Alienimonas californiensis]|uniref:hypothetical protein n=1 Tax=Alienimonas californiensis TaxID=2527989 RepID=UPI0011A699B4|nr:hypothetical protein [Alienimonas californiensis]
MTQKALNLSVVRAEAVKRAIAESPKGANVQVDLSALTPTGAGISDPVIPKPRSLEEAKENMRVEFRIVRVNAEALGPGEFDFSSPAGVSLPPSPPFWGRGVGGEGAVIPARRSPSACSPVGWIVTAESGNG